eukprot:scaffold2726_cov167-Amphora_coffeaeformis.AAC.15
MIRTVFFLFAAVWPTTKLARAWDVAKISGIWKLSTQELPRIEPTIVDRALGRTKFRRTNNSNQETDIDDDGVVLLKLNPDGSFRQCNEGYVEGAWIVGKWSLVGDEQIKFILNRQYYGPAYDIAMEGQVVVRQSTNNANDKNQCLRVEGYVYKGRVRGSNANFFRDGFLDAEIMGPFHMIQSVTAVTNKDPWQEEGALLLGGDDGVFQ